MFWFLFIAIATFCLDAKGTAEKNQGCINPWLKINAQNTTKLRCGAIAFMKTGILGPFVATKGPKIAAYMRIVL
ncbi:hypothetical protein DBR32_12265 [Taibaiella sp. KBW10]|nr:hypothetical protein DBR32_12265 [Taibaiella sp. KBW10]